MERRARRDEGHGHRRGQVEPALELNHKGEWLGAIRLWCWQHLCVGLFPIVDSRDLRAKNVLTEATFAVPV